MRGGGGLDSKSTRSSRGCRGLGFRYCSRPEEVNFLERIGRNNHQASQEDPHTVCLSVCQRFRPFIGHSLRSGGEAESSLRSGLADHTRDLTSQPIENPMASIRGSISLCDPRPRPPVPRREVRGGPECFTRKTGGTRFSRVSWEHEGSAEPHSSSPNGSQEVPSIFVRGHRPALIRERPNRE